MRMRSTTLISSATAVAAAAAFVVLPATGSAAQDGTAPAQASAAITGALPAAAKARTKVVLKVNGCEGCTLGAQRALDGDSPVRPKAPEFWDGPSAKVKNGKAVLRVPTRYTSGMSFTIVAPWEDDITNAITNVVVGYPGVKAGTEISKKRARHADEATACWAGTGKSKVVLRVEVRKVRAKVIGGGMGKTPLAWLSPTKKVVPGTASDTWKGIIGNQDAYYC